MEDKKVIVIEGENHTIKSLSEMADKENVKVIIVDEPASMAKHISTIEKFAVTGYIIVCAHQLAAHDLELLKEKPKHNPLETPNSSGSLTDLLRESIKITSRELELIEPLRYEHKQELREVRHAQAKPVKQFSRPVKNHHFKRK